MRTPLPYRTTGEGSPLLLLHGAAEDACMLTPLAEAFAARGRRVAWYDRRGTGASPRDGWPGSGMAGHAADAARIVDDLGGSAQVLGFSSGGVVAMALAALHPDLDLDVLAWEPPAIACLPGGPELHARMMEPVETYLAEHPEAWRPAYERMLMIISGGEADLTSPEAAALMHNAEPAVCDDARMIVTHAFAPGDLDPGRVRLARGTGASELHHAIVAALEEQHGLATVVIDTDDHEAYLWSPEMVAAADWARP